MIMYVICACKNLQCILAVTFASNLELAVQLHKKRLLKRKSTYVMSYYILHYSQNHGLRTPKEGIILKNLKHWADVADKICFGRN